MKRGGEHSITIVLPLKLIDEVKWFITTNYNLQNDEEGRRALDNYCPTP